MSFINRGSRVVTRSTPFPKEPAFVRAKSFAAPSSSGGSASNAIAFAWDPAAGKLYLDLNRNLDLTDDPDGVFGCLEKNYSGHYQTFANVRLPVKTPSGNRETLVDLNLNDYGSRPGCTAAVHSFWQGKVTLQGVECQVGVVENPFSRSDPAPDGYLLLRRWAARNEPFNTDAGSFVTFPFPRKLFFKTRPAGWTAPTNSGRTTPGSNCSSPANSRRWGS